MNRTHKPSGPSRHIMSPPHTAPPPPHTHTRFQTYTCSLTVGSLVCCCPMCRCWCPAGCRQATARTCATTNTHACSYTRSPMVGPPLLPSSSLLVPRRLSMEEMEAWAESLAACGRTGHYRYLVYFDMSLRLQPHQLGRTLLIPPLHFRVCACQVCIDPQNRWPTSPPPAAGPAACACTCVSNVY